MLARPATHGSLRYVRFSYRGHPKHIVGQCLTRRSAHKSTGECSVCHAVRQLHNSNGTVHRHGPRHNPCPGSDKPPATVRPHIPAATHQQTATPPAAAASQHNDIFYSTPTAEVDQLSAAEFTHPTLTRRTIKHILKSARPACAKRYDEGSALTSQVALRHRQTYLTSAETC